MTACEGRCRAVIEGVTPQIDGGRFPIKRVVGDTLTVEADIFADGHDVISAVLLYRREDEAPAGTRGPSGWAEVPMEPLANDRWRGSFKVTHLGRYRYTLTAWVDRFRSWRRDLSRKVEAGQDVRLDLLTGAQLVAEASRRAAGADSDALRDWSRALSSEEASVEDRARLALSAPLAELMSRYPDRRFAVTCPKELPVVVDRPKARFSAWYEMFPRSCSLAPGIHGTLKDCVARLPYIASMGFDVLYLPPVHPIGRTHRKGKNNAPVAGPDDVGSPWAIGSEEGGHKAVHPLLGTLEDFRALVAAAREHGIEVALDLAFQCSPDHPYVRQHPEWFRWRPDGTVQYAENPPKKYEDIFPFDFESDKWQELWEELKSIVLFWTEQGIRMFRVDNPHTKPLRFWEWLISEVKARHPDAIFLSEAFTRPKVMYHLAKLGFTQSYTYFAWRNTRAELAQYLTELTQTEVREYFSPNLWPNTPDILTEYLQLGGRPAFMVRLVLAATLSASYGIYGPAFELCEARPREPGSEEYLDSEKYQVRHWDLERADSLRDFIARVNRVRRQNPALQSNASLRFHPVDNEHLICYSKHTEDAANVVIVVVDLDPHHPHAGWVDLEGLGIGPKETYQVHDQLTGARYLWRGSRNFVALDPAEVPAHVLVVRKRARTERDFDYFM